MSSVVTPGRVVLVRLAHGWRMPGVVIVGCADWQEGHPVTVRVFSYGSRSLAAFFPGTVGEQVEKRARVIAELERVGAAVHADSGFVIVDLPEAKPDDEHEVGWFFPPREGSR